MQLKEPSKAVAAANLIKRAMRLHRDRIMNLMMDRKNASREVLIAYSCIYAYSDDVNDCSAIMGNDWCVSDILLFSESSAQKGRFVGYSTEQSARLMAHRAAIIKSSPAKTSKGKMRAMIQSLTREEIGMTTGWLRDNHRTYHYPDKYLPRIIFLTERR